MVILENIFGRLVGLVGMLSEGGRLLGWRDEEEMRVFIRSQLCLVHSWFMHGIQQIV